MLMKEYRICMPLTVEEVSFCFFTLFFLFLNIFFFLSVFHDLMDVCACQATSTAYDNAFQG